MRPEGHDEDRDATGIGRMADEGAGAGAPILGAPGPDGAPSSLPAYDPPAPALDFDAVNVPCLRDCRFYFRAKSHFEHGNPAGTFPEGLEPKQNHHICTAIPGVFLELSADSPVYECTHWDPRPLDLVQLVEQNREQWFRAHPEVVEAIAEREQAIEEFLNLNDESDEEE